MATDKGPTGAGVSSAGNLESFDSFDPVRDVLMALASVLQVSFLPHIMFLNKAVSINLWSFGGCPHNTRTCARTLLFWV